MSAVVVVRGQVRGVRDLRKKSTEGMPGERFARSVSLLTEAEDVLGETLPVVAWDSDFSGVAFTPGDVIEIVAVVDSGRFGLEGTMKKIVKVAGVAPLDAEIAAAGAGWPQ